jgi:5-formyltetrahydrofolate cyclo-ligase
MAFYRYLPQTSLTQNRYGIVEPAPGSRYVNPRALALMLIPLVAFDSQGTRLGMGGGFYDRFLGAISPGLRPRLVGIAHEVQRSATALPVDSWDIPLNAVVTEAGWQKFR